VDISFVIMVMSATDMVEKLPLFHHLMYIT